MSRVETQRNECREGDLCPMSSIYYLGVFRVRHLARMGVLAEQNGTEAPEEGRGEALEMCGVVRGVKHIASVMVSQTICHVYRVCIHNISAAV